jgi:hypothetical protein
MEKYIEGNKVAVLVSPGYGAGWFTWNFERELIFSPKIVKMIMEGRRDEITEKWIEENLDMPNIYCGGVSNLEVVWLPIGTKFTIIERDGHEEIITVDDFNLEA